MRSVATLRAPAPVDSETLRRQAAQATAERDTLQTSFSTCREQVQRNLSAITKECMKRCIEKPSVRKNFSFRWIALMSSGHVLKDTVQGREVLTARTNAPSHFDTPQSTCALATDVDLEVTAISMVRLGKQSILILCCIFFVQGEGYLRRRAYFLLHMFGEI